MANVSAEKGTGWGWIEANRKRLSDFHLRIWGYAETAWREYRSAAAYCDLLRSEGFTVEEGTGEMPTAFVATWGQRRAGAGHVRRIRRRAGPLAAAGAVSCAAGGAAPVGAGAHGPALVAGDGGADGRVGREGGDGAPRAAGHAAAVRGARGEGVRVEARARRQGVPGRRRRVRLVPPAHHEHDDLGHALRVVLERRRHLRVPGAGDVDGTRAVLLCRRTGPTPCLALRGPSTRCA